MKRPAVAAFDAECAALSRALRQVTSEAWSRLTNCPPWDLHELVVHIVFSIRLPDQPHVTDDEPLGVAADYYRRAERVTDAYRSENVDRTRRIAANVERGSATSLFEQTAARTSATFAGLEPNATLDAAGRKLRVDDYALTRLMSVAAHGIDVAITLDVEPWTAPEALAALRSVLVDLLGSEPPTTWRGQDLLELGTGRRPLTPEDASELGEHAARFPLLS